VIKDITISIVSHGHGVMVSDLCNKLLFSAEIKKVIVTLNIPEAVSLPNLDNLKIIRNETPKGFASNHNAAFGLCDTEYFIVLNPDVELDPAILQKLKKCVVNTGAKLVAPLVRSKTGELEDSIRRFPTISNLLMKALGQDISRYSLAPTQEYFFANWVAGMFMMFDSKAFEELKGFDEKFFLYYEDVDICARFWIAGYRVAACQSASIIHDAQRDSRKRLRYMGWHLNSLSRYFYKYLGRLPKIPELSSD